MTTTTQAENAGTNRGPHNGSESQNEAEKAVLGVISRTTPTANHDACSQELEQLEADSRGIQQQNSVSTLVSQEKTIQRRGTTTQTIPTRWVRSPRRLLEVLKNKYGEDGYTVEMRHNVYTVVTRDGKGKLSQASLSELGWS